MQRRVFIFWSMLITIAVLRTLQSFNIHAPDIGNCLKKNVGGTGVIAVEPQRTAKNQVLVVDVGNLISSDSDEPCASDLRLRLTTHTYPMFHLNQTISFTGNLSQPFNFTSNGRTFDLKSYLAKDDIYYEIKSAQLDATTSESMSESLSTRVVYQLTSVLFNTKLQFIEHLQSVLGEPHAALASGLVVGEKAALGNDLINDFRTVGLIHIVVLSGFNITIVGDALRKMLSFLPRIWGMTIGGIAIVLFCIMVGGGSTVIRSCIMALIALGASLIRRDYNVSRALLLAALLMIIESPMIVLHDPSFQLSFLATLGLVLLANPIEQRLSWIPDMFGMRGFVAATLATQIFVSPFILYLMGQISLIGVVVNILVLPFIPATMLFVFLTGSGGFIWMGLSYAFGMCAHILLSYELFMVENFARIPFAALDINTFPLWIVISFYAIFVAIYIYYRKKKPPVVPDGFQK